MIKTLIATKPDDVHAIFVKLALNKFGYVADLWYPSDFPSKSTYSLRATRNHFSWLTNDIPYPMYDHDYDIVWFRRPSKPILPDYIHPDDVMNAKKENVAFIESLFNAVFPSARWINPVAAAQRANSKLLQLKIASQVGLNIPNTLVSNDPKEIKLFLHHHDAIYKTIHPVAWIKDDEMRLTYTKTVTTDMLPSDKLLQCTPGIFQEKIDKQHELRITYFGEKYVAVKIHSQLHEKAKLDWRSVPAHELLLEQVELPEQIDYACRSLMKQLGIVFGCFDFIVTPDNEYYFLEVNEQGQFLWIESVNPGINMLQPFVEFITQTSYDVSMNDFLTEVEAYMQQAVKNHVNPPQF